ncbi:MAG: fumarylacetoacetase [Thermoleophilaceae bacterium]|nr:fumarylacetoacetase [Thermoleophilaceae bacterium]
MALAYGRLAGGGLCARVDGRVLDLSHVAGSLDELMARGPAAWEQARQALDSANEVAAAELGLPFEVADYVDFYSSIHHARNVGLMFRPDAEPLLENWRQLPVGYHGRAGTVVPSGTAIRRPVGQRGPGDFGPTQALDVELELGFVIGVASEGPVPVERALDHVFGAVLLNDWSARDIQGWEYRPLGPLLGKSFATSISQWVVPLAELEGHRVAAEPQDPEPLPYLREPAWAFDIQLEIELNGAVIARGNARNLYWSIAQQIAHLTSNGAGLRVGDLLGSGTISGPERDQRGCLLELSWAGREPIELPDGSTRTFLEDGDEVVLRGEPLGEVRGAILPSR